jgi:tRNA pseudouridine38-40 synthase
MRSGALVTGPARYRAVVAYTGTAFHGWQIQTNAPRTVQGALQDALSELARGASGSRARAAPTRASTRTARSRTSTCLGPRDPRRIRDAVNDRLPPDVRVLSVSESAPEFHARHDAKWKEYLYRWSRSEVVAPREFPFVAPISAAARAELMREAAAPLRGERDFGVFAVQRTGEGSEVRRLDLVEISEEGAELRALFRGNGFLRGMVRSICGVLADSARGRIPAGRVAKLLATGDRTLLSAKAPAKGLTLVRVSYENGS